jgi:hypothetical protein
VTPAELLADFCKRSISAEPKWAYTQARPYRGLGVPPDEAHENDCSGHATLAYYWAGAPDPNGSGYNGSGYTGTLVQNPRVSSGSYEVGDLAIYGDSTSSTEHVCTCHGAGSASSARWTSHGSGSGPYAVSLHYRSDLLVVVRPGLGSGGGGKEEPVESWVGPWLDWYVLGQHREPAAKRPADAPEKIPEDVWELERTVVAMLKRNGADDCFTKWLAWYQGGKLGKRPECAPGEIPEEWWEARTLALSYFSL